MARSSQLQAAWQVTGPSVNMCSVFTMGVGMSVSLSTRFSLPKTVRIPKKKIFFFSADFIALCIKSLHHHRCEPRERPWAAKAGDFFGHSPSQPGALGRDWAGLSVFLA